MAAPVDGTSKPFVSVTVTSTANPNGVERRYEKAMTISALKCKLELVTGAFAQTMKLAVYKEDKLICEISDNEALLGSFPIEDGMVLHAEDESVTVDEYNDTSKVEKFVISEEEYNKRTDSIRAYKQRHKIGQFNKEEMAKKAEAQKLQEEAEAEKAKNINVNERCEVRVPGQATQRGVVKFVGEVDFQAGFWVGVHYDGPQGKHDGSVGERRYFQCPEQHGDFVRPSQVEVGNFPEKSLDFSDDEM